MGKTRNEQIPSQVAAAMATQTTRAVAGNVRIYCVTFGATADTAVHQVIANQTGGAFYYRRTTRGGADRHLHGHLRASAADPDPVATYLPQAA